MKIGKKIWENLKTGQEGPLSQEEEFEKKIKKGRDGKKQSTTSFKKKSQN